jgi:hypothetical protein
LPKVHRTVKAKTVCPPVPAAGLPWWFWLLGGLVAGGVGTYLFAARKRESEEGVDDPAETVTV